MLKTFIGKFTFFFWLSFFIVNIPMYFLGVSYVKDVLKVSEEDKISLMTDTLKPIIALNLSFNQEVQLASVFENILTHKDIHSATLELKNGEIRHYKSKKDHSLDYHFNYETSITDPFQKKEIAKLNIYYLNSNLKTVSNELIVIFTAIFIFVTIIFFIFFIFILRKDIHALSVISKNLKNYLRLKVFEPIELNNYSEEVTSIIESVNDVAEKNSIYLKELEKFNNELEDMVSIKVAELKEQKELIVNQSRQAAMGEMLESIAHQWRQPLNIIGLATTQLDLAYKLNTLDAKSFDKALETISFNTNYMSNTIDDFRNFINPVQNAASFSPEKCFEDILHILDAQLKNNDIDYSISSEKNIKLYGVDNEFIQVALILINNSIDAIKSQAKIHKDKNFKVTISIKKDTDSSLIEVTDNGGGIKEDILHSIFEPYFTTKFASQGTGIGLHIVKNIIESRMKGSISVSNTDDGCCFRIKVPLDKSTEDSLI